MNKIIFYVLFMLSTSAMAATHVQTTSNSAVDNTIVRMDGTSGQIIQNSSVIINDSGNVGIGSASPTRKLDVAGGLYLHSGGANNAYIAFDDVDLYMTSGGAYLDIIGGGLSGSFWSNGGLVLADSIGSGFGYSIFMGSSISTNRSLTFTLGDANRAITMTGNATLNQNVDTTATPTFVGLRTTSNVGIGSITPGQLLDVNGTMRAIGFFSSGNVGIGTSIPSARLQIGGGGLRIENGANSCFILRDTDDAGWTECCALNGVLSCGIDADGLIDGTP